MVVGEGIQLPRVQRSGLRCCRGGGGSLVFELPFVFGFSPKFCGGGVEANFQRAHFSLSPVLAVVWLQLRALEDKSGVPLATQEAKPGSGDLNIGGETS